MELNLKPLLYCFLLCASAAVAAEGPYFVTYTSRMEEPGNLEVENKSATGNPATNRFWGSSTELEYGVTGWWTSEFYLDQQYTGGEGGVFAGDRWENRFRLSRRHHWIDPVLYAEFENTTDADKSLLEVVGHDASSDLTEPNFEAVRHHAHEVELKVLLGSYTHGWNLSENLIAEKNMGHEAWEFGYALGLSRRLSMVASPHECGFCRENLSAGVEMYGGLGDWTSFGLHQTSHYVAPVLAWDLPSGLTFKASTAFGVTQASLPLLVRLGVSYEIPQIARLFRRQGR
jgi:hypothetical protein